MGCSASIQNIYGICIYTLHLPAISVMIIGIMRLSYNERAVSEGRFRRLNLTNFRGFKLDPAFTAFSHDESNSTSGLDGCGLLTT